MRQEISNSNPKGWVVLDQDNYFKYQPKSTALQENKTLSKM